MARRSPTISPLAPARSAAQTFTLGFLNGTPVGGAQNIVIASPLMARKFEYSDPDFRGMFSSPIFRTGWVRLPTTDSSIRPHASPAASEMWIGHSNGPGFW